MDRLSKKNAGAPRQLRTLILCPSAYQPMVGGVEELTKNLALVYQSQGYKVIIFTSKPAGAKYSEILQNIPVHRFFFYTPAKNIFNTLRFLFFAPLELTRLLALTKKYRPQLLHIQCNGNNTWYIGQLAKLTGLPLVDTLQGETVMDEHQLYQRSFFARWALRQTLARAAFVTGCSQTTLNEAKKYFDFSKKSLPVFNGIDLQEFAKTPVKIKEKYIFATGRFTHNKGFDLLIKAFAAILPKYPELKLFIGGDGMTRKAAKQYIADLDLEKNIKLLGRLDRQQTVKYLKNALFVVMPSRHEPFGIVALEALAAGKAVLATNNGGPPEFITKKVGLLFNPENHAEFVKKLEQLIKTYRVLEKHSKNYVAEFAWTKIAAKYLNIYKKVIKN